MQRELLPCPFCGCEVTVTERSNGLFAFLCPPESSCIGSWIATYGHGEHRDAVFRQWNTRAPNMPAIVIEARQGHDREDGHGAKHESAGRKASHITANYLKPKDTTHG